MYGSLSDNDRLFHRSRISSGIARLEAAPRETATPRRKGHIMYILYLRLRISAVINVQNATQNKAPCTVHSAAAFCLKSTLVKITFTWELSHSKIYSTVSFQYLTCWIKLNKNRCPSFEAIVWFRDSIAIL